MAGAKSDVHSERSFSTKGLQEENEKQNNYFKIQKKILKKIILKA